jgi:hypothetical protein
LNSADFPTFGRPTMATIGSFPIRFHLPDDSRKG